MQINALLPPLWNTIETNHSPFFFRSQKEETKLRAQGGWVLYHQSLDKLVAPSQIRGSRMTQPSLSTHGIFLRATRVCNRSENFTKKPQLSMRHKKSDQVLLLSLQGVLNVTKALFVARAEVL